MKSSKKKPAKSRKDDTPKKAGHLKSTVLGLYGATGMMVSLVTLFSLRLPFADGFLKQYWRHAVVSLLLILTLLGGMVAAALHFLDTEDIKTQVLDYVRTIKHREIKIEGDIELTFFPSLGLDCGKVTLSHRDSKAAFASIDNARLYISWWPLLLRQVRIERIVFDGLQAHIVRHKDGSTNFDDLLDTDGRLATVKFELEKLRIIDSTLNLLDQNSGSRLVLSRLNVETGLLQDSTPGDFKAGFHLHSGKDKSDADVNITSRLYFDREQKRYEFAGIQAQATGNAYGISNVNLDVKGKLMYHPANQRFVVEQLAAQLKGVRKLNPVELQVDLTSASLDSSRLSGQQLTLQARSVHRGEKFTGKLDLPEFSVTGGQLQAPASSIDLALQAKDRSYTARALGPLNWTTRSRELHLPKLDASIGVTHPAFVSSLQTKIGGELRTSWAEQSLLLDLRATLDDSKFEGKLQMRGFDDPAYSFDIGVDNLDLDRYLAVDWSRRLQADAPAFDFSSLRGFNARGRLHADGELRLAKLRMKKFATELRADKSGLQFDALQAELYGGKTYGSLALELARQPRVLLRQSLKDVQLHALLGDLAAGEPRLLATGDLSLDVQADASSPARLRKSIAGRANFALARGSLSGINLSSALVAGQPKLGTAGAQLTETSRAGESTAFNELRASLDITRGRARNLDLLLRGPGYTVKGEGESDLAAGLLNYCVNANVDRGLQRAQAGDLALLAGKTVPASLSVTPERSQLTLHLAEATGQKTATPAPRKGSKASTARSGTRRSTARR